MWFKKTTKGHEWRKNKSQDLQETYSEPYPLTSTTAGRIQLSPTINDSIDQ